MPDRDISADAGRPASEPRPDPLSLEKNQPDPMLQMTAGRMGAGGLSLLAIAVVAILVVVFWGLNGRDATRLSSAPSGQATSAVNSGAPHG